MTNERSLEQIQLALSRGFISTRQADSLKEAQAEVYAAIQDIQWPNFFYRHDIGWRTFQ